MLVKAYILNEAICNNVASDYGYMMWYIDLTAYLEAI